jgi:polyisoprenoid-binding protein YceI
MEKTVLKKYLRPKSVLPACFLFVVQTAFGQLHPIAKESSVHFSLRNFGFKTGGTLAAPEGDIIFNPDELTKSSFKVTIKTESINTDNESRDEHLREEGYFNVKNYPLIHFVSDNVRGSGKKGEYEVSGALTIKNKTKAIVIPFTTEKSGNGWLFTGSFNMNRRDFDIGGSSTISNELTVDIKVVAH